MNGQEQGKKAWGSEALPPDPPPIKKGDIHFAPGAGGRLAPQPSGRHSVFKRGSVMNALLFDQGN